MLVRYEDLAVNTEEQLRRVCEFIGLEFAPEMLEYWNCEDVSIGGNRMRRTKAPVQLDQKWIRELPVLQRIGFGLLGGWLNRLYGYPLLRGYWPASIESRRQLEVSVE
jgi:hypothetical protein